MKKTFRPLMMALCLLSFWSSGNAINPYLQGDVNDDDRVNITDVTDLIDALLSDTASTLDGYGDVNGDGRVTISDVTDLIDILFGAESVNENTVSVSIPEDAPITVDDVVVMGYGSEIAPSTDPRHLRDTGTRYYVSDANAISVLTRDGKLVYDSYVSFDINNHERSVKVDALETAYTMLIPIFTHVFDSTPDYIYSDIKNRLAGLNETRALATAIDRSIVRHGYFEIADVEAEYTAAVDKVIDKLGLRDNFMSGTSGRRTSLNTPTAPSIPYGEYGHVGLKLKLNSSEWIPADAPGGGGGGSWIAGGNSTKGEATWHCNLTAYNSGRFAYTSWTRGYIDDNGNARPYSDAPADLLEHILKPQRVATFMKTFKTWSGLKDYFSDSWKLITEPDFGFADMTWDCTKVKFDMDFTTPRDVVIVCGPDQQVMLFYNLLKAIVEPMTKELFKNLDKASKEEGEFMTIFCAELVMDLEYSTRFTAIWQGNGSLSEKAKAIAELTWPKLKESIKTYVQERIDLWTKDRCIEIFGFVDIAKLETGIENVTKNMNKYLKVVEKVGDGLLSTLGVLEAFSDTYGSGYYTVNLDFNDAGFDITEGLVAYYPFNGNANDESGNGNHGSVIGNVVLTTDRFGSPNSAYHFPGQPFNYISVPDNETLHISTFTLSAWVYTDENSYGRGYLIDKGRDINNGTYGLGVGNVRATNEYGATNDAGSWVDPQYGVWHMITGTVEGDQIKFYVDGVLIDERTLTHPFVYSNSDPLTLGMHYYGGVPSYWAYPLLGVLDDVRIYNRALSASEIAALYNYSE